jgi:hypothetical protein
MDTKRSASTDSPAVMNHPDAIETLVDDLVAAGRVLAMRRHHDEISWSKYRDDVERVVKKAMRQEGADTPGTARERKIAYAERDSSQPPVLPVERWTNCRSILHWPECGRYGCELPYEHVGPCIPDNAPGLD